MKISETQQRVLNLMKEGWTLRDGHFGPFLELNSSTLTKPVLRSTVRAMARKRLIAGPKGCESRYGIRRWTWELETANSSIEEEV